MGTTTPRVLVGEKVRSPFVAGILKPIVFLPEAWASTADGASIEAVLRHEISHIRSGDLIWALVYRLSAIALWPQPLIWLIGKPMAAASEDLSDATVLGSGCPGPVYANALLNLNEHSLSGFRFPGLGIAAISSKSSLRVRVERILTGVISATRPNWLARLAILALVSCIGAGSTRLFAAGTRSQQRPETKMAAPAVVKITIVDPDGKPLPNAQVYGVLNSSGPDKASSDPVMAKLAPQDGQVTMDLSRLGPHDTATLIAEAPGYGMSFVRVFPVTTYPEQLKMHLATRLEGTVKLPDGTPAAGVAMMPTDLVIVSPRSGSFDPRKPAFPSFVRFSAEFAKQKSVVTDEAGHFAIDNLPQGASTHIEQFDDRFASTGGLPTPLANAPTTTCPTIQLRAAAVLQGRVLRAGKPVAGLTVGAQGATRSWGQAITDANGYYKMGRLQADVYNVAMNLSENLEQEVTAVAHGGLHVAEGQQLTGIDFDLIPGAVIEGQVTRDGKGFQTTVGIYGPAHPHSGAWVQMVTTDKSGNYKTRVPAGEQYVYVAAGGIGPRTERSDMTVTVHDGEVKRVDLNAPPEAINP